MFTVTGSHDIVYTFADDTTYTYDLQRQHTLVSRFDYVFAPINLILEKHPDIRPRFDSYIRYMNEGQTDAAIHMIDILHPIVSPIAEGLGFFDYTYSAPPPRQTLLHIDSAEYRIIMETSFMLKMFGSLLSYFRTTNMPLVRAVYSRVCDRFVSCGILYKMERIIDSVVMGNAAKGLDMKSMLWVMFATSKGFEPNNVALRERNNILYKGLATLMPGKDPVKYLVSMARTALNFQMKDRIPVVNIATNVPIESVYESTANVLETFVYEEITANRALTQLATEYGFANRLKNKHVEPITAILAAPFMCMVLDVPMLHLTQTSTQLLLNLLVYRFMSEVEPEWELFTLLRCSCKNRYDSGSGDTGSGCTRTDLTSLFISTDDEDGRRFFISKQLATKVRNAVKQTGFADVSIYTSKQLCDCISRVLRKLLSYDFYDHYGNKVVFTKHAALVMEYVEYLYGLITGRYDAQIQCAKQYLRNEVTSNNVKDRVHGIDRGCAPWTVLEDESASRTKDLPHIQTNA